MYQCSLPASFRNVQSSFSGTFLLFVHFDPHLLFKFVSLFAKSFICNVYYLVPYKFSKVCLLLINCVWKKQKRTRITSQQMVKKIVRWGGRRINRTLWEGEKDTNGSPLCQDSGSHSESLLKLELLILSLRVSDRSSRHPKLCDKMGRECQWCHSKRQKFRQWEQIKVPLKNLKMHCCFQCHREAIRSILYETNSELFWYGHQDPTNFLATYQDKDTYL